MSIGVIGIGVGLFVASGALIGGDKYYQKVIKPKKEAEANKKAEREEGRVYYEKLYVCNECEKPHRLYQGVMYYSATGHAGCPHCKASLNVNSESLRQAMKDNNKAKMYQVYSLSRGIKELIGEDEIEALKYAQSCPSLITDEQYDEVENTLKNLESVNKTDRETEIRKQFNGNDASAWKRNIAEGVQKRVEKTQDEMVQHATDYVNIVNRGKEGYEEIQPDTVVKEGKKNKYMV